MKKSFFKKLAFVLAASMVVPAVIPAASGSAAAAPDFAKRQTNVYEGKSYSYTVKNVPAGGTVKWTATGAGKDYVKFSKKTGATNTVKIDTKGAMAAKNAAASVKASVYNKAGKLVKGVGDGVTVKVSATALDIVVAEGIDMKALPADTAVKFSRKITPSNATSVTYWSVTKADGTAVDAEKVSIDAKGNFKASEKGDYKVTAEAKNAKTGKVVASKTVDVTVGFVLDKAAQLETKKIDLTFKGTVGTVSASDFSIVNDANKIVIPIKSATVSDDKTKVTIDTLQSMNDGKTYTVTYNGVSTQFTATDGKVAQIAITPTTVEKETPTDISAVLKDANGVVLNTVKYGSSTDSKLEFNLKTDDGYIDGSKLYMSTEGKTATASAVYHSYEYDSVTGEEKDVVKTGDISIVCGAKKPVTVKEYKYTVAASAPNWASFTQNTSFAVGDSGKKFFLTLEKSDGGFATDGYVLDSADPSILVVNGTSSNTKTISADLAAVKAGQTLVLLKNDKNEVIMSFPVTVKGERKATVLVLSNNNGAPFYINTSPAGADNKTLTVKVKDNYQEEMPALAASDITVTCEGAPTTAIKGTVNSNLADYAVVNAGEVVFQSGALIADGQYVYKISAKGLSRNVVVNVKKITTVAGNNVLSLSSDKVDVKFNGTDNVTGTSITFKVNKMNGSYVVGTAPITNLTIKKGDTTYTTAANSTSASVKGTFDDSATSGTVVFRVVGVDGSSVVTKLEAGTYYVTAEIAGGVKYSKQFEIVDTQSGVAWSYREGMENNMDTPVSAPGLIGGLNSIFKFDYEGDDSSLITAADVVGNFTNGTVATIYVKSVTVEVTVGSYKVPVTVTINTNVKLT